MSVRVDNAVLADEAIVSIVRGAVSQVEGVRLDRPGRVSRVLPGRRDAVSWELGERGAAFDLRGFHEAVLGAGPLGLGLLRGRVARCSLIP